MFYPNESTLSCGKWGVKIKCPLNQYPLVQATKIWLSSTDHCRQLHLHHFQRNLLFYPVLSHFHKCHTSHFLNLKISKRIRSATYSLFVKTVCNTPFTIWRLAQLRWSYKKWIFSFSPKWSIDEWFKKKRQKLKSCEYKYEYSSYNQEEFKNIFSRNNILCLSIFHEKIQAMFWLKLFTPSWKDTY